jgi:hypothetical protein
MVRCPTRGCAIRTRFFGLRLVEEVSFECPIRDKSSVKKSDRVLIR